jgi:carbon-monoxide dehydrogenase medium subunit
MYVNELNSHIIPVKFEYHAPASLEEAVELLSRYGDEASLLAGGTDLIVNMKQRLVQPKHIISIKNITELLGVEARRNGIHIGAATKLRTIERSDLIRERLPILREAVKHIGSVQIRNLGTMGGNLCNANPCADTATPLVVLGARAKLVGPGGGRVVPMENFFIGSGKTILKPNEILSEVVSSPLAEGIGTSYIKVGWTSFDIGTVNVAVVLKREGGVVGDCRIALGACAPTPMRLHRAEEFLKGKEPTGDAIEATAKIASEYITPRARWRRAPPEYRREVSRTLTRDALTIANERAGRRMKA